MLRPRVIPALLLLNQGLVKTVQFKAPRYLGDPLNIVRIFNDKEVDELVFLDINATKEGRRPPFDLLEKITSECFMPLAYGGGIKTVEDAKILFKIGIEKVVLNSSAIEKPELITQIADLYGSQAVVASIDAKKGYFGSYDVFTHGGKKKTGLHPIELAREHEKRGAGEIFLNSIDHDGTMQGYDLELIYQVTTSVQIPVIACGGARNVQDLRDAIKIGGASAAAAGSIFVYQGPLQGVLINYPGPKELAEAFTEA